MLNSSNKVSDFRIFSFIKCLMLFIVFMFVLYGCFGTVATPPPTSIGLFGNTPEQQPDEGVFRVSESKIISDFTLDEVFDAAYKAALSQGLNIEQKDLEKGMMTGNGFFIDMVPSYGPHKQSHTFAFYFEEISDEPQTKFTILVDTHSYDTVGSTTDTKKGYLYCGRLFIESIFADTLKVLATIR